MIWGNIFSARVNFRNFDGVVWIVILHCVSPFYRKNYVNSMYLVSQSWKKEKFLTFPHWNYWITLYLNAVFTNFFSEFLRFHNLYTVNVHVSTSKFQFRKIFFILPLKEDVAKTFKYRWFCGDYCSFFFLGSLIIFFFVLRSTEANLLFVTAFFNSPFVLPILWSLTTRITPSWLSSWAWFESENSFWNTLKGHFFFWSLKLVSFVRQKVEFFWTMYVGYLRIPPGLVGIFGHYSLCRLSLCR